MNEEEFAKKVWSIYEEELAKSNNSDYEIDSDAMGKFISAYSKCKQIALLCDGKIEREKIEPKELHGGITMRANLFYFNNRDILSLFEALKHASALSIDSTLDGEVVFSFTIPNIYKRKN